jgi:hypothetical protein
MNLSQSPQDVPQSRQDNKVASALPTNGGSALPFNVVPSVNMPFGNGLSTADMVRYSVDKDREVAEALQKLKGQPPGTAIVVEAIAQNGRYNRTDGTEPMPISVATGYLERGRATNPNFNETSVRYIIHNGASNVDHVRGVESYNQQEAARELLGKR